MPKGALQTAKPAFTELFGEPPDRGPKIATRRGLETAVVVSIEEWRRLNDARPTLKDVLLGAQPRFDIPVPKRGKLKRDRKSTRLNSSHANISYAVFCLKKKKSRRRLGDLPYGHRQ